MTVPLGCMAVKCFHISESASTADVTEGHSCSASLSPGCVGIWGALFSLLSDIRCSSCRLIPGHIPSLQGVGCEVIIKNVQGFPLPFQGMGCEVINY